MCQKLIISEIYDKFLKFTGPTRVKSTEISAQPSSSLPLPSNVQPLSYPLLDNSGAHPAATPAAAAPLAVHPPARPTIDEVFRH